MEREVKASWAEPKYHFYTGCSRKPHHKNTMLKLGSRGPRSSRWKSLAFQVTWCNPEWRCFQMALPTRTKLAHALATLRVLESLLTFPSQKAPVNSVADAIHEGVTRKF